MRVQRLDAGIESEFIRDQILRLFFSKRGVCDVYPVPGYDTLNRMVIHQPSGSHVDEAVDCIRRKFGQKFDDDLLSVCHM